MKIYGNLTAQLQIFETVMNEIGEPHKKWQTMHELSGFLDFINGAAECENLSANLQNSTHVFICDFVPLNSAVTSENSRMIINDKVYEVVLIDNPMEKNHHYEIFLRFAGGYNEV